MSYGHFPGTPQIRFSWAERDWFQAHFKLHPPWPSVTLLPYFPIILINIMLYLLLYTSVYILQHHLFIIAMKPTANQVRNHYS